jgi:quercetin dioxygenase-like cupin family protein
LNKKVAGEALTVKKVPHRPGTASALGLRAAAMSSFSSADQWEAIMSNPKRKLIMAGAFVACAVAAYTMGLARATPPTAGFTGIPIIGPVVVDEIHSKAESEDWKINLKTKGLSDVYVTEFKLAPGADGGWHSHPGPSLITVKSGTATFYDECDDFARQQFPAGTGFVEDAECVHLLANEGDVELDVIVMQIVPLGAPRRIDEANPLN